LKEAIPRFADGDVDALPVVDGAGQFRGLLSRDLIERSMRDQDLDVRVGDLARRSATVRENATLGRALTLLVREHSGLPVLATEGESVVGWLTHRDVLTTYASKAAEGGS
jgi:CIC family chloride channel protein